MTFSTFEKQVHACPQNLNFISNFSLCNFCFVEKGKLKHATVSPEPGETKDIRSYKVNDFSLALYSLSFC